MCGSKFSCSKKITKTMKLLFKLNTIQASIIMSPIKQIRNDSFRLRRDINHTEYIYDDTLSNFFIFLKLNVVLVPKEIGVVLIIVNTLIKPN